MKKLFFALACSLLYSCTTTKNMSLATFEVAKEETLVKVYAKIITNGTIEFLRYDNGYYQLSVYTYQLDIKSHKSFCTFRGETQYTADELIKIGKSKNWMKSSVFKQGENHDPYFKCFSEDFLELSNDDKIKVLDGMSNRIQERKVHYFKDIPAELLSKLGEMGKDTSSALNDYESKYLDFIFKLDTDSFSLAGKKVGFLGNKKAFFKDERERFLRGEDGVGGCGLYIFNATQKEESGGYDAAIMYWSKFILPIEKVIEKLKKK